MKLRATTPAALFYLGTGISGLVVWYIILFVGNPNVASALDQITFMLIDAPDRTWFRWLLLFPILCFLMSGAYVSPLSRHGAGVAALAVVGLGLAVLCWLTLTTPMTVLITVSAVVGILALITRQS